MNQTAANSYDSTTATTQWDSSLEVRFPSIDADYEWLGYEAVHPLTWVPAAASMAAAPAA